MNMGWMKTCVSAAGFARVPARVAFGIWWKIHHLIECQRDYKRAIEYLSNSIDLNRKDRASLLRRKGYEGQERYHKSSIFNRQYSIPACPERGVYPKWLILINPANPAAFLESAIMLKQLP
jgi:hypothetical protein